MNIYCDLNRNVTLLTDNPLQLNLLLSLFVFFLYFHLFSIFPLRPSDNLLIDYQFTFSLLQEDDRYYTSINFMATPEQVKPAFKTTRSGLVVSNDLQNQFCCYPKLFCFCDIGSPICYKCKSVNALQLRFICMRSTADWNFFIFWYENRLNVFIKISHTVISTDPDIKFLDVFPTVFAETADFVKSLCFHYILQGPDA